jgi:hypothetical protein
MTIGYHYATPRYARLINPREKEIKEIHFYGEIIAIILIN